MCRLFLTPTRWLPNLSAHSTSTTTNKTKQPFLQYRYEAYINRHRLRTVVYRGSMQQQPMACKRHSRRWCRQRDTCSGIGQRTLVHTRYYNNREKWQIRIFPYCHGTSRRVPTESWRTKYIFPDRQHRDCDSSYDRQPVWRLLHHRRKRRRRSHDGSRQKTNGCGKSKGSRIGTDRLRTQERTRPDNPGGSVGYCSILYNLKTNQRQISFQSRRQNGQPGNRCRGKCI